MPDSLSVVCDSSGPVLFRLRGHTVWNPQSIFLIRELILVAANHRFIIG